MHRRRDFLAVATGGLATGLAGCSGGDADETENDGTAEPTKTTVDERTTRDALDVAGSFRQYQYDATNSGAVPETTGPTEDVATAFEFGGAGTDAGHNLGTPAVVDGTLYVMEGTQSEDGDARTVVYALDAADGTVTWERAYEGTNVVGPVSVTDDVVLASFGGNLKALDRSTGEERWAFSDDLDSRPTIVDGSAYVLGADLSSSALYSVSLSDGSLEWRTEIDAEFNLKAPAVVDGTVFAGGAKLHALDAETGEEAWTVETDGPVTTPPSVADAAVVVGVSSRLHAYDPADGANLWRADEPEPHQIAVAPAVASGTIHVSTFGTVAAYDLDTGEREFTRQAGASGPPVVAGEHVYRAGLGRMGCRSRSDGTVEWSESTPQDSASSGVASAVASGVAYFPLEKLYAMRD